MNGSKRICVVTGSRAEYGLLYPLMADMEDSKEFDLQLIVTGMHLSKRYGDTVQLIRADGFKIVREIDIQIGSDNAVGICKSMGLGLIGFANAYEELKPDLLVLLGDRFELLSAASAALISKIPVAHIHGGEVTTGAYDDAIRHSITKMSHLHFTSTAEYRQRVIQLGECPDRVFNVGALGIDNIDRHTPCAKEDIESILGMKLGERNILVTFHPETLNHKEDKGLTELLQVLNSKNQFRFIFTGANADTSGYKIDELTKNFVTENSGSAVFHSSLGQERYLSTMYYMDAVVGNSSSGLIEAPSFRIATINIGDRQKGRVRAESVIDCKPNIASISSAFDRLDDPIFLDKVKNTINPHGLPGASSRILREIRKVRLENSLKKSFRDLPVLPN